jgi:hypothetical protein
VSLAAGVDKEPVKVDNVIRSGKGKYLFALRASGSVSKKKNSDDIERWSNITTQEA